MRKSLLILVGAAVAACVMATSTVRAQGVGGPGPGIGPQPPGIGGPGGTPGPQGPRGRVGQPGGPGQAGPAGQPRGGGPATARRPAVGLDLTADQRTQIQSIRLRARDEAGQLRDELTLARRTLRRQVFADKVDNPKLAELSARIATLQKQLADIRVKALLSTSAVLTPEQRQRMRVAPGARAGRRSGPPPAP